MPVYRTGHDTYLTGAEAKARYVDEGCSRCRRSCG